MGRLKSAEWGSFPHLVNRAIWGSTVFPSAGLPHIASKMGRMKSIWGKTPHIVDNMGSCKTGMLCCRLG